MPSITCPVCSTVYTAVLPLVWDNHGDPVSLSPDNLTASRSYVDGDEHGCVAGSVSHASGKYVLKLVPTYGDVPGAMEVMFGVKDSDVASETSFDFTEGGQFDCAGGASNYAGSSFSGITLASGVAARIYVDFDAGEIRYGSPDNAPVLTFTPNTPLWPFGYLTPVASCSLAIVQGYSEGDYSAW